MDILSVKWEGNGGSCCNLIDWEPCCGLPWNPFDMLKCLGCWYFCSFCAGAKLYAHSTNQDCSVVNHFLPALFCTPCCFVALRHNLRAKVNAGAIPRNVCGIFGDSLVSILCIPCALGQMLRSVDNSAWDWTADLSNRGGISCYTSPCIFCVDEHETFDPLL
eukprot:TRINITY_DN11371_c0_g1_i1.p1 TRINITY_DN11371_c0_g1~~TRINITY_DN11371_c0_g1_i1.p1  ORF type:complete len:177 (-),score=19.14 TRINITY_DN11371_c0_g1_i1:50-535(-)